ncbi:hypothetical protein DENSPDRAFT_822168 [Dentipellis sp. KUC8613]|nr:hypothetical protein DENSPDRAFT_822168 [Dentipellis sp. KUC8613]
MGRCVVSSSLARARLFPTLPQRSSNIEKHCLPVLLLQQIVQMAGPARSRAKQICHLCGGLFTSGGPLANHQKKCETQFEAAQRKTRYEARRTAEKSAAAATALPEPPNEPVFADKDFPTQLPAPSRAVADRQVPAGNARAGSGADPLPPPPPPPLPPPPPPLPPPPPPSSSEVPDLTIPVAELLHDDIHTRYHPKSKRPAETAHFEDYRRHARRTAPPPDPKPWSPYFKTREDFHIAEILHDAAMSEDQCDRLLKVFKSCLEGQGTCTLSSFKDVQAAWDHASTVLTPFECTPIEVPYKKETRNFDMYSRSLWDWLKDVLDNPSLISQFEWDARKIFKF